MQLETKTALMNLAPFETSKYRLGIFYPQLLFKELCWEGGSSRLMPARW